MGDIAWHNHHQSQPSQSGTETAVSVPCRVRSWRAAAAVQRCLCLVADTQIQTEIRSTADRWRPDLPALLLFPLNGWTNQHTNLTTLNHFQLDIKLLSENVSEYATEVLFAVLFGIFISFKLVFGQLKISNLYFEHPPPAQPLLSPICNAAML